MDVEGIKTRELDISYHILNGVTFLGANIVNSNFFQTIFSGSMNLPDIKILIDTTYKENISNSDLEIIKSLRNFDTNNLTQQLIEASPIEVGYNFQNSTFKNTNFGQTLFVGIDFDNSKMDDIDFFKTRILFSDLKKMSFINSEEIAFLEEYSEQLKGMEDIYSSYTDFYKLHARVLMDSSFILFSDLSGLDLKNNSFRATRFNYSKLENVDFRGADLSNADLRFTNLKGVNLLGTNLHNAKVAKKDWKEQLERQEIKGIDYVHKYFYVEDKYYQQDSILSEQNSVKFKSSYYLIKGNDQFWQYWENLTHKRANYEYFWN